MRTKYTCTITVNEIICKTCSELLYNKCDKYTLDDAQDYTD